MSRSKKLYVLLGILAAVCAVTFAVSRYEEHKEQIKNSDEIILEIDSESVTGLSWEYDSASLAFHKDETWVYDGDEAFPVDEEKLGELLGQFAEFGVSFVIEAVEDYGQYGLKDPLCTIQIKTEEENYTILLGDYSAMDSERYVSIGDGNVYLAASDPLDYFDAELDELMQHDELPALADATEIQFAGEEAYTAFYEEESPNTCCAEDLYFVEKNGEILPLDTSLVEDYLGVMTSLSLTDYVTYHAGEEDLDACGLTEPDLSIAVEYTVPDEEDEENEITETFVLHIARDPEEKAQAEEAGKEAEAAENTDEASDSSEEEEEITAYARVGESSIIYQLSGDDYEALMAYTCDDLRHKEVLAADFNDIYQVDITLEGENYTLTSEKNKDEEEERSWYYQEEELPIESLKSALLALRAGSFTEEEPSGKKEISLTVYLDNENYPEISVDLYRYDGSDCLAVVDGEPVSLVARSYVVDLIEAVNAIVLN